MKKLFISLVALVAVLASCSKSAVVEVPYENIPISFSSYNGKTPTVKSTSFVGNDSLAHYGFQVYGYLKNEKGKTPVYTVGSEYMNKVVKGTKNTEGETTSWSWGYEGVSYWPGTMFLDFVAYGLNANKVLEADNANSNMLSVKIPATVAEQKDVLVAVPHTDVQYADQGEGANNGTVALKFKHLLSRVSFGLVTKESNPVFVTMENIELKGLFNTAGSIDLTAVDTNKVPYITATTPTDSTTYNYLGGGSFTSKGTTSGEDIFNNSMLWTKVGTDTPSKNDDVYTSKADATDAEKAQAKFNEANRYMMIMPTEAAQHNAELNVTYFLPSAGSYNVKVTDLSSINFEAGKSYKFLLKVSTNAISFSVEVSDWVDGTVTEIINLN